MLGRLLKAQKPDILFLMETKIQEEDIRKWQQCTYFPSANR
jgi:exonuclease III